ncbi:hypothetical protein Scep_030022 [Stephania cephalantha]|uniref:Uncharacterized protein n=1 Tax=Stephania cephalantha TaxID=152367 RepID=A0AAP0HGH8_9MAGN
MRASSGSELRRQRAVAPASSCAGEAASSGSGGWPAATVRQRVGSAATNQQRDDAMDGLRSRVSGAQIETRARCFEVRNFSRAGRQGPRPKSDVFHGRPSILSGFMDGS